MSGLVFSANFERRSTVTVDSFSKVGSTVKKSASCWSFLAVTRKTSLEFSISERSWPSRSDSAPKTTPVLRTRRETAPSCESRSLSSVLVSSAKGSRLPSASLRS